MFRVFKGKKRSDSCAETVANNGYFQKFFGGDYVFYILDKMVEFVAFFKFRMAGVSMAAHVHGDCRKTLFLKRFDNELPSI